MPGIMYYLDMFEKAIVDAHVEAEGELPAWLEDLNCETTVEFPSKMTAEFPKFDITMAGMPDAVFKKRSGKLCLVDYKTALAKGDADPFWPIYRIQLAGYVHLLEANKIGVVDSAALVYFENQAKAYRSSPLDLLSEQGFHIPFKVTIHEVDIDRSELEPLLKRFRDYADLKTPPEGLEKCKDCAKLEQLFKIEQDIRNMEDVWRRRDQFFRLSMYPEIQARRQRAKMAWDLTLDEDLQPVDPEFFDSVPVH